TLLRGYHSSIPQPERQNYSVLHHRFRTIFSCLASLLLPFVIIAETSYLNVRPLIGLLVLPHARAAIRDEQCHPPPPQGAGWRCPGPARRVRAPCCCRLAGVRQPAGLFPPKQHACEAAEVPHRQWGGHGECSCIPADQSLVRCSNPRRPVRSNHTRNRVAALR